MKDAVAPIPEYLSRVESPWTLTSSGRRRVSDEEQATWPPEQVFAAFVAGLEIVLAHPYVRVEKRDLEPGPKRMLFDNPQGGFLGTLSREIRAFGDITRERIREGIATMVPDPSQELVDFAADHYARWCLAETVVDASVWLERHLRNQPDHPISQAIFELATRTWQSHADAEAYTLLVAVAATSPLRARPLLEQALRERSHDPLLVRELRWQLACVEGYYENPPPPGTSRFIV